MTDQLAAYDPNRVPTLIGVDSTLFTDTTLAAVNPTTHALLTESGGTSMTSIVTNTANTVTELQVLNSLVPNKFDNIGLTYTGTNLTSVVYKLGATTVVTLTLSYDGSDNLITVART